MKIHLAILDNDTVYLQRLCDTLITKYSDRIEVYAFSSLDAALADAESGKCDVFIANKVFEIDVEKLPTSVSFAYLVDSKDIESLAGQKTICRFQRTEQLYKEVLDLYALCSTHVVSKRFSDNSTRIFVFTSPCRGTGCSTLAVGYANRLAMSGKRVLYLDLQTFATADSFFPVGNLTLSDVVFALKSKNVNLSVKLQSCVQTSPNGVFYFSQPLNPLDIKELSIGERDTLITTLQQSSDYDIIIIDIDYSLDKDFYDFISKADAILYTCDGTENSNSKLLSCLKANEILEQNYNAYLREKTYIIYNKFSNKISKQVDTGDYVLLGGVQRFESAVNSQIVDQIANKAFFDKLLG